MLVKPRLPVLDRRIPLTRGLVGAWPFAERGGTTSRDLAGGHLDATMTNGPTWTTGAPGPAVILNAAGSTYIEYGTPAALNLLGALTFAAWVRRDSTTSETIVLSKRTNAAGLQYQFEWIASNSGDVTGRNRLRLILRMSGGEVIFYGTATHTDSGIWHHVAVTYDQASVTFYWDGTADGATAETRSIDNTGASVHTGWDGGSVYCYLTMADLRVWSLALSARTIATLYARPWALYGARPLIDPWRMPVGLAGLVTARHSLASPADGTPRAELLDRVSGRWSPQGDTITPSTITATANGVSLAVTYSSAGGGAYDWHADFTFIPGRSYAIETTVQTAGGRTNTADWSFTVREAYDAGASGGSGRIVLSEAGAYAGSGVLFPQAVGLDTAWAGSGIILPQDPIDFGDYAAGSGVVVVVRTVTSEWPVTMDPAIGHQTQAPATTRQVGDTTRAGHRATLQVTADRLSHAEAVTVQPRIDRREAVPMTIDPAVGGQTRVPTTVDVEGEFGALEVEIPLRSEAFDDEERTS